MTSKWKNFKIHPLVTATLLLIALISCSGGKWALPDDYRGAWACGPSKVTVRTWQFPMRFNFFTDTALITIQFNENQTASGKIGDAAFSNAIIRKNKGNPEKTGVALIIECGDIGKIFPGDPLTKKEVELWVGPMKESGFIDAELRYTSGLSQFPMAGIQLKKVHH